MLTTSDLRELTDTAPWLPVASARVQEGRWQVEGGPSEAIPGATAGLCLSDAGVRAQNGTDHGVTSGSRVPL